MNYILQWGAVGAFALVVIACTWVQVSYEGEQISQYQYREQSLQYQEDIRDTLDQINTGLCN